MDKLTQYAASRFSEDARAVQVAMRRLSSLGVLVVDRVEIDPALGFDDAWSRNYDR